MMNREALAREISTLKSSLENTKHDFDLDYQRLNSVLAYFSQSQAFPETREKKATCMELEQNIQSLANSMRKNENKRENQLKDADKIATDAGAELARTVHNLETVPFDIAPLGRAISRLRRARSVGRSSARSRRAEINALKNIIDSLGSIIDALSGFSISQNKARRANGRIAAIIRVVQIIDHDTARMQRSQDQIFRLMRRNNCDVSPAILNDDIR